MEWDRTIVKGSYEVEEQERHVGGKRVDCEGLEVQCCRVIRNAFKLKIPEHLL